LIQVGRSIATVRSTGQLLDVAERHIWTIRDGAIHPARFYIDSDKVLAALDHASAN
jgi:ketosteroid isomerase-like protein